LGGGLATGRIEWLVGTSRDAREVTIYVKGFLFGGERPDAFEPWLASHRRVEEQHGWHAPAAAWVWQEAGMSLVPLPLATATRFAWDVYRAVRLARSVAVLPHLGLAAAEVVARFVAQYAYAVRIAEETAHDLATAIAGLVRSGTDVRVVAHSLGCRAAIAASALLDLEERPREIHLLAPACVEDELGDRLEQLARRRAYLYFNPSDPVLAVGFRALALRSALGSVGPSRGYPGLVAIDASNCLGGLRAHGEYKHRLAELIAATADVPPDDGIPLLLT
jgi:hypothetical protein